MSNESEDKLALASAIYILLTNRIQKRKKNEDSGQYHSSTGKKPEIFVS